MRSFLVLLAAILICACGDDDHGTSVRDAGDGSDAALDAGPVGPVEMVFSLEADAPFFDRPFPLEARRTPSGQPSVAGFPNPRRLEMIDEYVAAIESQTSGFSPSGPIWMRFTGPLDPATFPADTEASRAAVSPIVLLNVQEGSPEEGELAPFWVSTTTEADSYRPVHLLQMVPVPGFDLLEDTLYAVIVRAPVASADPERPLRQSAALRDLLAGTTPPGELGAAVVADFERVRHWVDRLAIDPATVMGATVFRTGNVTERLHRAVDHAITLPPRVPVEGPTLLLEMPEYCAYSGVWEAPQHQTGMPPFDGTTGELQLDAAGHAIEQRLERVPFVVAMPKSPMPAAGFPLLFYVNGTGGLARQVIDRGVRPTPEAEPPPGTGPAQVVARRGWGSSGMAGPITEERVGTDVAGGGYNFYDFQHPVAMRDNFFQSVLEHVMFRRLVQSLRIDPSTCPGSDASAAPDGMLQYDPTHVVIMGQSLGSFLTGMLTATDVGTDLAILTGAGGSWIEFAFNVESPVLLATFVRLLLGLPPGEELDRFHPVIAAFDLAVGPADNTHYLDELVRNPRAGHTPKHLLIIEGDEDDNIGPGLQRALVAAIGADLVGPDVGPAERRIEDTIRFAGHDVLTPPVTGNVETAMGPRTVGVVRYLPDLPLEGHYVTFQLEGPKLQYACFLDTYYRTGTPVIVAPGPADGPCP